VSDPTKSTKKTFAGIIGAPLALLVLWMLPLGMEASAQHAIAVVGFLIVLWLTEAVDHGIAALAGCYLFWSLGVTEFRTAFAGFTQDTPWFLYGAMMIAAGASKTGLAKRIAWGLMSLVGTSFERLFLAVITMSFLMTLIVPSGLAQVATVAPILIGLVAALGLGPGSNVGRSLFATLSCTAGLFNKMVLQGAASLTGRGLIVNITQTEVFWSDWALAFLPAIPLSILGIWRAVLWLYPPEPVQMEHGRKYLRENLEKLGPWSAEEKRAFALILLALGLWATDRLHHASPALVGIGVGLLLCVPKLGVLENADIRRVNFLPILFVGGALSMSSVLLDTGALSFLTGWMTRGLSPLFSNFTEATAVLYWSAFVYHFFLGSELPMLSTSMPAVIQFAAANGLNPVASGMVWTFAASAQVFVYQSAVLILGYSYGYYRPKDLFKIGGTLAVVEFLILMLLVTFYWPLIGLA